MQQSKIILILIALLSIPQTQALQDAREVAQPVGVIDKSFKPQSISLSFPKDNYQPRAIGDEIPGAKWLRLQLVIEAEKPLGDLSVSVLDGLGNSVETINLQNKTQYSFWTKLIPSDEYVVQIEGTSQSHGTLTVAALAKAKREFEPLSIIEPDQRQNIEDITDPRIRAASRAVMKIYYQDDGTTRSCTGFLISTQRIVTNEHCINSQKLCDSAVAIVEYNKDGMASPKQQSKCVTFKSADPVLDISVLDFDSTIPAEISPFKLAATSPSMGTKTIKIIQFASNEPKKISNIDCSTVKNPVAGYDTNTDFSHQCDTVRGSSGSPVLTENFEVTGLHHLGINGFPYNRAVRIELIRTWLQSKGLISL